MNRWFFSFKILNSLIIFQIGPFMIEVEPPLRYWELSNSTRRKEWREKWKGSDAVITVVEPPHVWIGPFRIEMWKGCGRLLETCIEVKKFG